MSVNEQEIEQSFYLQKIFQGMLSNFGIFKIFQLQKGCHKGALILIQNVTHS